MTLYYETDEQKKKRKAQTKQRESKLRAEGFEIPKTIWIRKDILSSIEVFKEEYKQKFGKRITLKQIVNEALFDLILRKKMEIEHGQVIKITDTMYDPDKGTYKKP